jgi:peptide/nickel transport system permease protein
MRSVRWILFRKVVNALITLFIVIALNFVLFHVMPGNPVRMMIPQKPNIDPAYVDRMMEKFGLDQPLYIQFFTYVKNVFSLEFGDSFRTQTPVKDLVLNDLTWTLILMGTSSIFMVLIGMTMGILAAWKRGSWFDTSSLGFSLFFYAMPTFWFAMMLILVFALQLHWFPTSGELPIGMKLTPLTLDKIFALLDHLFLPAVSLTVGSIAAFSVVMRSSLVDVMTEDYITTARAKGLSELRMLKEHAVPNAMLPMVTLIAMDLAFVVGGAFQTEFVFDYEGIGYSTVVATQQSDYPYLQAAFLIIAVVVIFANFVADISLVYLDPRVKMK